MVWSHYTYYQIESHAVKEALDSAFFYTIHFFPIIESIFYEILHHTILKTVFCLKLIFLCVNQVADSSKAWYALASTNTFEYFSEYFHYWRSFIRQIVIVSVNMSGVVLGAEYVMMSKAYVIIIKDFIAHSLILIFKIIF